MNVLFCLLVMLQPNSGAESEFDEAFRKRCIESTVRIRCKLDTRGAQSFGTGVIIKRDGSRCFILTANHIFEKTGSGDISNRIKVDLFSKKTWPQPTLVNWDATRLPQYDEKADLAILQIENLPEGFQCEVSRVASFEDLGFKDEALPVLSVGCDQGAIPSCVEDRTRAKKLVFDKDKKPIALFWETEKETIEGRSGGGLYKRNGRDPLLIGICSAKQFKMGYYTHADEINGFVKKNGFDLRPGTESGSNNNK